MSLLNLEEAETKYGIVDVANKKWERELEFMKLYTLPEELIYEHWLNILKKPVTRIYCNIDMWPSLLSALNNIHTRGLQSYLKTFDGLYNIRYIRGRLGIPSTHSYGLALDINSAENPLGGPTRMIPNLAKCFTDQGFIWGNSFARVDGMHFQYAHW